MKATKKPVTIDFLDYKGIKGDVKEWVESFGDKFEDNFFNKPMATLSVKTLEGTSYDLVAGRDIIIRGVEGEYYPCREDIFRKTYDIL